MTHSTEASFETKVSNIRPETIGFRGLVNAESLIDKYPYKGSDLDRVGPPTTPDALGPIDRPTDTPQKNYPVESYYLNGAQYLTGGVGNRLSFQ